MTLSQQQIPDTRFVPIQNTTVSVEITIIFCRLYYFLRGAFDSVKTHKRQRRKRQSVTAKRDKSQKPKFV